MKDPIQVMGFFICNYTIYYILIKLSTLLAIIINGSGHNRVSNRNIG
jgi:hypothetical protein